MSASAVLKLQKVGFSIEQVEALADFMDTQTASKVDLERGISESLRWRYMVRYTAYASPSNGTSRMNSRREPFTRKRANSAIVTSTIQTALETTMLL